MRRASSTIAVLATALALAACGGPTGDLMAIEVSGGPARYAQRIVIHSNGEAFCNNGKTKDIGSQPLLDAREVERELTDLASRAATYTNAGATDVPSYVARTKDGTVRWQEGSPGLPPVLPQAQLLALQLGRQLC
jgi:hypothetical protein